VLVKKLRIFLADDHAVLRDGLKMLINAQPDMEIVGEAGDGKEAVRKATALQPDVVVMDVSMPEWNGVQATERLKQAHPRMKILALTAYEDEHYLRQLLKVGASGCVLKREAGEELTQAIRTVASGGVYLDPSLANRFVDGYLRKASLGENQRGSDLSEREAEVLRLIAWGYANKEIAAQLHLSVKTIETYKTRLMEKLNLRSRADIVRYALRQGWLKEK
jgi:DNA-binding NarL/FixJ family response regulator